MMDGGTLQALVHEMLARFRYETPPPGTTLGIPWSAEKVYDHVERLKRALVDPYLQRFELRETYEQSGQHEPSYAEYWVVAESGCYLEWYDPATGEFGLGQRREGSPTPVSIGVRGDLVGVFFAM
jgi:hypothetical protein